MARITPDRLIQAARRGWERRAWLRDFTRLACEQIAGPWYDPKVSMVGAERSPSSIMPVNILATMLDTYMPQLAGQRWDITCDNRLAGMEGDAKIRSLRLTHLADEINLPVVDHRVLMDAMISGEGIYRIGLREGTDAFRVDSEIHDPGQPFVVRVGPGDFVRDPLSRHWMEDRFQADRYIADRQALLEAGIGDPDLIERLPAITEQNQTRDVGSPLAAMGLNRDDLISDDLVQLWHFCVWDGQRTLVCVVPDIVGFDGWVVEPHEYEGPERGPYEFLHFNMRPDRATPTSMAMRLMDLHFAIANVSARTVGHIIGTKRNMVYDSTNGKETAMSIQEAVDDQPIAGDPQTVKEVTTGGLIPQFVQGFEALMNMASNQGATLQETPGRFGEPGTATEASLVAGKAQALVEYMRDPLTAARRNVIRRLSWYEDTGPARQQVYGMQVAPGMKIDVMYDSATKEGDWGDYLYNCRVKSASGMDSNTRLARLSQVLQVLPPWVQFVASMGGNVDAAMRLVSGDFTEMDNVFPTQSAMMAQQFLQQAAGQPGQATGARPVGKQPTTQIGQVRSDATAANTAVPPLGQ